MRRDTFWLDPFMDIAFIVVVFDNATAIKGILKKTCYRGHRCRVCTGTAGQWGDAEKERENLLWKVPTGFDQQCNTKDEINHQFEWSHFSTPDGCCTVDEIGYMRAVLLNKQCIQFKGELAGWERRAGGGFWQQALIKTAAGANSNILHPSLFTSFILTSVHNFMKSATCADSYWPRRDHSHD